MSRKQIPIERQLLFHGGGALIVVGILTFLSSITLLNLDQASFDAPLRHFFTRPLIGMGLILLGGTLRKVGSRGLAGSGFVLDPQQAREDLEPWTRSAGGMVSDALEEAQLAKHLSSARSDTDTDGGIDFADRLRKLHQLCEEGVITTEEFAREKAQILGEPDPPGPGGSEENS